MKIHYIILFPIAFFSGLIGFMLMFISVPLFMLFNPNYELPEDKAFIDVAPVASSFYKFYENYMFKHFKDRI